MVWGAMVLMRRVQIGTMYKLLGITFNYGHNSYVVLDDNNEEDKTPIVPGEKKMLWHQRLWHNEDKGLQELHGKDMVKGISN